MQTLWQLWPECQVDFVWICRGKEGLMVTHKRYWFRNCLPQHICWWQQKPSLLSASSPPELGNVKKITQGKCWNQFCQKKKGSQETPSLSLLSVDSLFNPPWRPKLTKFIIQSDGGICWQKSTKYQYWRPKSIIHSDGRKATNIQKLSISWKEDLDSHML